VSHLLDSTQGTGRERGAFLPPPVMLGRTSRTRSESEHTPLQRISIELGRNCNLRCTYCYAQSSPRESHGLSDDEVLLIIREAVDAGACLVSIVGGGEPLLRASLTRDGESCIDQANALGCYCHLYTNCTPIDRDVARWLHARDVSIVGKLNSLRESVQDELAGLSGASTQIRRGLDTLLDVGMSESMRLGCETIVCRQNYDETPELWRWMRQRRIVPEVEIPTLQGRAKQNRERLYFSDEEAPRRYKELFEELLRIDREEFGFDWIPHPPFPAMSCRLYYSNCYINERGGVQPCAGVDREYGFVRVGSHRQDGRGLAEIVGADDFRQLRRIHEHLKEPCRGCDLADLCYGCRGAAFHQTGDLFAGDPVCWRRCG
jgi:radical SAM protein with 4Fe4S-binding SPASM domain